jgi:hypothetical protein
MRGVDIVEVWNMEGDEGRATLNAGELIFYKKKLLQANTVPGV